jgi:hypothetical protein
MTHPRARKAQENSLEPSKSSAPPNSFFGFPRLSFRRGSCLVISHLIPLVAAIEACAAPVPLALHSRSGQFIVSGMPIMTANYVSSTNTVSFVRLDPALVAVSCEKIKWALLDELGLRDQWQGTVTISIHSTFEDNEPIDVTSVHYRNGWKYRLNMPDQVDRSRFIRAVLEALVSELANRKAGSRAAELPPWLVIGLAKYLEGTSLSGLTLEPQSAVIGKGRTADPLMRVREMLQANRGLTIDQLNWPGEFQNRDQMFFYQSCAHLFVHDLLYLRNGRPCMVDMLKRLHQSLNWQTTFFQSFGKNFERLSDLDKWWSSRLAQFSPNQTMPMPLESQWRALAIVLETTAARSDTSHPGHVSLQTVIADWELTQQTEVIQQTAQLLRALHPRASEPIRLLINDYLALLQEYLAQRHPAQVHLGRSAPVGPNQRTAAQSAIRRLNELDARRLALKAIGSNYSATQ